jgi:hypothetical protein
MNKNEVVVGVFYVIEAIEKMHFQKEGYF